MDSHEYRKHLESLGATQKEAAALVGKDIRTSRRWAAGYPIPRAVALLLRIMVRKRVSVAEVERLGKHD